MASAGVEKRKRVNLSVKQKLELIEKLESGWSVARVCEEYGVKKQTVSDIRKAKEKLRKFVLMCDVDSTGSGAEIGARKHMKMSQEASLEEAVLRWYVEQRSGGAKVRRVDLKAAANAIAADMKLNFKASDGWIWRFYKRHGIDHKRACSGEAAATAAAAEEEEEGMEPLGSGFYKRYIMSQIRWDRWTSKAAVQHTHTHTHPKNQESIWGCCNGHLFFPQGRTVSIKELSLSRGLPLVKLGKPFKLQGL